MTTHLTKIWWDLNKHKLVEQVIPEAEIYKREWVGLTDEEIESCNKFTTDWGQPTVWLWNDDFEEGGIQFARAIEARLKEKNNA